MYDIKFWLRVFPLLQISNGATIRIFKPSSNTFRRIHDPRTTFITAAQKCSMDEFALKLMTGHQIDDVTEKTYTHQDAEWLRKDLEKIDMDQLV